MKGLSNEHLILFAYCHKISLKMPVNVVLAYQSQHFKV
jgi:hypothetical protein